jgi:hypothetical protein
MTVNDPDKHIHEATNLPSLDILPGNNNPLTLIDSEFPLPVGKKILDTSILEKIVLEELPSKERAVTLIDRYYKRAAWE